MLNKYSTQYIKDLLSSNNFTISKKDAEAFKKARCALEFYFLLYDDITFSANEWARRWQVSSSTSSRWVQEFKEIYKQSYKF